MGRLMIDWIELMGAFFWQVIVALLVFGIGCMIYKRYHKQTVDLQRKLENMGMLFLICIFVIGFTGLSMQKVPSGNLIDKEDSSYKKSNLVLHEKNVDHALKIYDILAEEMKISEVGRERVEKDFRDAVHIFQQQTEGYYSYGFEGTKEQIAASYKKINQLPETTMLLPENMENISSCYTTGMEFEIYEMQEGEIELVWNIKGQYLYGFQNLEALKSNVEEAGWTVNRQWSHKGAEGMECSISSKENPKASGIITRINGEVSEITLTVIHDEKEIFSKDVKQPVRQLLTAAGMVDKEALEVLELKPGSWKVKKGSIGSYRWEGKTYSYQEYGEKQTRTTFVFSK